VREGGRQGGRGGEGRGGEGVLRWWGGESRVEPSGGFVVMAGGGLGGGVLGGFFMEVVA